MLMMKRRRIVMVPFCHRIHQNFLIYIAVSWRHLYLRPWFISWMKKWMDGWMDGHDWRSEAAVSSKEHRSRIWYHRSWILAHYFPSHPCDPQHRTCRLGAQMIPWPWEMGRLASTVHMRAPSIIIKEPHGTHLFENSLGRTNICSLFHPGQSQSLEDWLGFSVVHGAET